jgi:hypothetical protein
MRNPHTPSLRPCRARPDAGRERYKKGEIIRAAGPLPHADRHLFREFRAPKTPNMTRIQGYVIKRHTITLRGGLNREKIHDCLFSKNTFDNFQMLKSFLSRVSASTVSFNQRYTDVRQHGTGHCDHL